MSDSGDFVVKAKSEAQAIKILEAAYPGYSVGCEGKLDGMYYCYVDFPEDGPIPEAVVPPKRKGATKKRSGTRPLRSQTTKEVPTTTSKGQGFTEAEERRMNIYFGLY